MHCPEPDSTECHSQETPSTSPTPCSLSGARVSGDTEPLPSVLPPLGSQPARGLRDLGHCVDTASCSLWGGSLVGSVFMRHQYPELLVIQFVGSVSWGHWGLVSVLFNDPKTAQRRVFRGEKGLNKTPI